MKLQKKVRSGHIVATATEFLALSKAFALAAASDEARRSAGFGAADYAFSPAEDRLSAVMTGYWTNFAKTGDPNGPGLAEWPRFTDANHQTLVLDDPIDVLDGWRDLECDFFDSVPLFVKSGWFHSGRFPSEIPFPGPR